MEITQITITPIFPKKKSLLGFASIILDNILALDSIGIHTTKEGKFRITWPCRKLVSGSLYPYFKPLTPEFEEQILEAITKEIKRLKLFEFIEVEK